MYVGESERKLRLALSVTEQLAPTLLFIDEITETTPSRDRVVTDGGVSMDLLAQLLKFSARDDLRGRVLLIGASNIPERLDVAWHDRFIIIPFLELLPDEICRLFTVHQRRMKMTWSITPDDPRLVTAAHVLHDKSASPRKVVDIVNHALLWAKNGTLTADNILQAAHSYCGPANAAAVAYSSLIAISMTSFQDYLPWSPDPQHYVYPAYLEGVVDKATGALDRDALDKRIQEYATYARR